MDRVGERVSDVSTYWLRLIEETTPIEAGGNLANLIEINKRGMKEFENQNASSLHNMSDQSIEKFMMKEKYWKQASDENKKRQELLRRMLEFRKRQHIEMLDFTAIRKIVSPKSLIKIFSKSYFVNFTVQETAINALLSLQGYFLKNFIYFHLRHDMRFKSSIDSFMIEMDNPYSRSAIREENRKDPLLSQCYLDAKNINLEDFCRNLLENHFPNISGIWADHNHMAPAYILQLVRISLEYGMLSPAAGRALLPLLMKATQSLMKLEEGWSERPDEKSFSIHIKLFNVTHLFAKCREHVAMIVMQLLILFKDEHFMQRFPTYLAENRSEADIEADLERHFVFFDQEVNDSLLFITMNYLSSIVVIKEHKSTNEFCKDAVEKIFQYVTTTTRDGFLNSIRQIDPEDLKYIDAVDVISKEVRETADEMGITLRYLLEMVGNGCFEQGTAKLDMNQTSSRGFEAHIRKYLRPDSAERTEPTLVSILKGLVAEVLEFLASNPDYKVAVVKESIPLKLIALTHYCSDGYFSREVYKTVSKECFSLLRIICLGNNFCKSQIFKGESLFHFRKLLALFDEGSIAFVYWFVRTENNAAIFLGREVFSFMLRLYQKLSDEICHKLDIDNPIESLQVEKWATLLVLSRFMIKLFSRNFLNERERIQNQLLTQEVMFANLNRKYLPILIQLSKNFSQNSYTRFPDTISNEFFMEGCEETLLDDLEKRKLDDSSRKVFIAQACFTVLRLYNRICSDVYSSNQRDLILPQIGQLETFLHMENESLTNHWMFPVGLEAGIMSLIRNFKIMPQQNILIENRMDTEFNIVEASFMDQKRKINAQIRHLEKIRMEIEKEVRVNGANGGLAQQLSQIVQQTAELQIESKSIQFTEIDLILKFCRKIEYYLTSPLELEKSRFIYEGLLPTILKYMACLRNLSVLNTSKKIRMTYSKVELLVKVFSIYFKDINALTKKEEVLDFEEMEFPPNYLEQIVLVGAKRGDQNPISVLLTDQKKEDLIHSVLTRLIHFVLDQYKGTAFAYIVQSKRDLDKEKYLELAKKFEENVEVPAHLKKKADVMACYVNSYEKLKELYLHREEEPNLIGFFDRNTQNLKGVFNSCLDRLLSRTKLEKNQKKLYIAKNIGLSKFWVNPSSIAYVNMMTMLVEKSEKARKELDDYINKSDNSTIEGIKQAVESKAPKLKPNPEDTQSPGDGKRFEALETLQRNESKADNFDEDQAVGGEVVRLEDMPDHSQNRKMLLTVLLRIHADLVYFLNSNGQRSPVWWITHQTYEMISSFFKNLCECNYMPFKTYLGEVIPLADDANWSEFKHHSFTKVFSEEFKFIMKTTKLAQNRDPELIPSDFSDRVQPILLPLVKIMNEVTLGPCIPNQEILIETDVTSLCNIATRLLNDLNSSFFELATLSLSLVSALIEGCDKKTVDKKATKIANRLPATIIADRIQRLTKKLYVLMLIEDGKFDKGLKKLQSVLQDQKKPAKNQVLPISEKNYREADGTNPQSKIITEEMEKVVEIKHWDDLLEYYMEKKSFSDSPIFNFVFRLFVIWKTLSLQSKNHQSRLDETRYESDHYFKKSAFLFIKTRDSKGGQNLAEQPSEMACIYYFLDKKILCEIEMLDLKNRSVIMFFPRLPACFMLSEEAKRNYRNGCDISDSNTKMVDLLRNYNLFSIQMDSSFKSSRQLGFVYNLLSTDAFFYYTYFCWIFSFVLNVVMLLGYEHVDESTRFKPRTTKIQTAMNVISWMLIAISSLLLILWMLTKYTQTYRTKMEDYKFDFPGNEHPSFRVKLYVATFRSFVHQPFPMSYTLHVVFSLLGIFVDEVFFVFNLFLIINISNTAKFVLQSILLHWDQLLLTLMLAMFVIFLYTILAMEFLYEQIKLDDDNKICDELYRCFFYVLNTGLRNGGGWAESLRDINKAKSFPGRTFHDMTFFMLITVISLNIIFGIIIDTFSQLRDDEYLRRKLR